MKRLIIIIIILNFSTMLSGQEKYKIYGGDKCTFDYLIYAPSGKKSDTNPKIIQLCDYQKGLYESFETDSLRKLPEFKNYDFYYIPNARDIVAQRLECLDVVQYKATIGANISSDKNVFLFINDPTITQDALLASNLKEIYTNIILISDFAKTDDPQNESIKIDAKLLINAFKSVNGEEKSKPQYLGPAQNFNFTLSGILKDAETGESLPFANLLVKGTSNGTTTNIDGYFTLHNVPSDTSTVIASYIGYKKKAIKLNPNLSKTNLSIEIASSSLNLNEIVITAQIEDVFQVSTENIIIISSI